jgi:hypothetical protein
MNKFSFTISVRIGNHVDIRYLYFNDIYPSCIHKERHLITLVVFFIILHIVDSDNSLFFRNNDVFLLIFGIKYVKHLCNSYSENSMFIFMTHISQVNDCEPIIINFNTLWVLHPLTFKIPYAALPNLLLHLKIRHKLPLLPKIYHLHNLLSIILLGIVFLHMIIL